MDGSSMITFGTVADVLDVAKLLRDAPAMGGGTDTKETEALDSLHILETSADQRVEIIAGGSEVGRGGVLTAPPAKVIPRVPQVVHAAPALQGSWGPNSDAEARKRVVQAPVRRKQAEHPRRSLNTRCRVTATAVADQSPKRTPPPPPSGNGNVSTDGALTTWASPADKKRKKSSMVKIRSPPPIAPAASAAPSVPVVGKSPPTHRAPGAPQRPTFIKVTPTSVQIEWSSPACDNGMPVTSYKLMLDDGHGGRLQTTYEGAATSYKASKLMPGSSYRAAVQAVNAVGVSDLSGVAAVTLPVAPSPAEIKLSNKVHVKAKQEPVTTLVVQCRTLKKAQQQIQARQTQQQLWSPQTWRWARVVGVCATIVAASVISVGTISIS